MAFAQPYTYGGAFDQGTYPSYGGDVVTGGVVGAGSFVGGYGGGYAGETIGVGGASFVQDAGAQVAGYEHVRLRVPARQQVRTTFVPGPVINRSVQGPAREVVRRVRVQGPEQIQRVQVQGPGREVVRRVQVQGPERVVTRTVQVTGPTREVVRRQQVQGPPREVLRRVEVQGPPREVIRRVEVQGPPQEQIQTVQVAVPGPPREVIRKVAVPRDVVRQVVKHVNVDQWVDQPVMVQGPGSVHVRFLVDQPPRFVPRPQPVFRTQLVPQVVLVPHTTVGMVPVPHPIHMPPRVAEGPTVPDHLFQQQFGHHQIVQGGFGGFGHGGFGQGGFGGFGPNRFNTVGGYEHLGAPQIGGFANAGTYGGYAGTFGGVYDQGFGNGTVIDQGFGGQGFGGQIIDGGFVGGSQVIGGQVYDQGYVGGSQIISGGNVVDAGYGYGNVVTTY